jgi:hypothetical protein
VYHSFAALRPALNVPNPCALATSVRAIRSARIVLAMPMTASTRARSSSALPSEHALAQACPQLFCRLVINVIGDLGTAVLEVLDDRRREGVEPAGVDAEILGGIAAGL